MPEDKVTIIIEAKDAEKVREALRQLGIDVQQIGKDIGKAAEPTNKFSEAINGMIKGLVSVYAAMKVWQFLKECVTQAAEAEDAIRKLRTAVENAGISWDIYGGKIQKFLETLQSTTVYTDEQAAQALQNMMFYTKDLTAAMEGVKLAMDMASSGMFNLETAGRYLGMAMAGNVEILGRYVPQLRAQNNEMLKTMTASEKTAYAVGILKEKFAGMSAVELETTSGKVKHLGNMFSELKEKIGVVLIDTLNLKDVLQFWTDVIDKAIPKSSGLSKEVEGLTEMSNNATKEIDRLNDILKKNGDMYVYVNGILKKASDHLEQQERLRTYLTQKIKDQTEAEKKLAEEQKKAAEEAAVEEKKFAVKEEFQKKYEAMMEKNTEYQLQKLEEEYERYSEFIDDKAQLDEWYEERKREILEQRQEEEENYLETMLEAEQEKIDELRDLWLAYQDEVHAGQLAKMQTESEMYQFMIDNQITANKSLWTIAGSLRDTFSKGMSQMFVNMIKGTASVKEAFKEMGYQMIQTIIDYMVQMAVSWALSKVMTALAVKTTTAAADTIASAWATPAYLASVATLGSAAVIGAAALAAGMGANLATVTAVQTGASAAGLGGGVTTLQEGGIVERPTLALLGEKGKEAVIPLEKGGIKGFGDTYISIEMNYPMITSDKVADEIINKIIEEVSYALSKETERYG